MREQESQKNIRQGREDGREPHELQISPHVIWKGRIRFLGGRIDAVLDIGDIGAELTEHLAGRRNAASPIV